MKFTELARRKLPLVGVVALYLLMCFLVTGCPIKFMTGIPCPGCGMTRAVTSCLHGDFAGAFHFHPLYPIAPLLVAYIFFEDMLPRRISVALCAAFAAAFLSVYIFRVFFTENSVTAIDLEYGIVVKLIKLIISHIGG